MFMNAFKKKSSLMTAPSFKGKNTFQFDGLS